MFKKNFRFPLDVMQNSVVSTQILSKIYRAWLKECAYHKIQVYFDQNYWRKIYIFRAHLQCGPIVSTIFLCDLILNDQDGNSIACS